MPSSDFLARFGGLGRLFGAAALARLAAARVAVVGVGGVGSWAAEGLARSGIGGLTLIDLDDVCVTNVNRQLPALDGQIGRPKVTVLAERIALIHPGCRVETKLEFFTAATAPALLAPGFDFLIDAVDRMSHKALLIAACRERGIPVLTVGGAGGRSDPGALRTGDLGEAGDELLRQVRRKLRRAHGVAPGAARGVTRLGVPAVWSAEDPVYAWADGTCNARPEPGAAVRLDCAAGLGSAVFVTGLFGLAAAGEVVRRIARGSEGTAAVVAAAEKKVPAGTVG